MKKELIEKEKVKKNLGVRCASRCMNQVKLVQIKQCKKLFHKGKKIRRCSWKN